MDLLQNEQPFQSVGVKKRKCNIHRNLISMQSCKSLNNQIEVPFQFNRHLYPHPPARAHLIISITARITLTLDINSVDGCFV